MNSLRVDVRPILEVIAGEVHAAGTLPGERLVIHDETFEPDGPIAYDVTITNTGAGMVALGSVAAPVLATCSRCLAEFSMEIVGEVEGFWVQPGHDVDLPEEQEVDYIAEDASVDIAPALMAAIVIEAPFAPLHDEDCAGLCSSCGSDLNEGPCGCDVAVDPDHPLAGLKVLLDEPDRSSSED